MINPSELLIFCNTIEVFTPVLIDFLQCDCVTQSKKLVFVNPGKNGNLHILFRGSAPDLPHLCRIWSMLLECPARPMKSTHGK